MILYTPMQLELVLEGFEDMKQPNVVEVDVDGVPALVQDEGCGKGKLVKLLSTDPRDYINPGLIPGTPVSFVYDAK